MSKVRVMTLVWLGLLALLAATVTTSLVPLGGWNLAVNLAIAFAKMALVLLFFMRLGHSPPQTRLAAVIPVAWLGLLTVFSLIDILWRTR